jgi:hypothetical protein
MPDDNEFSDNQGFLGKDQSRLTSKVTLIKIADFVSVIRERP